MSLSLAAPGPLTERITSLEDARLLHVVNVVVRRVQRVMIVTRGRHVYRYRVITARSVVVSQGICQKDGTKRHQCI